MNSREAKISHILFIIVVIALIAIPLYMFLSANSIGADEPTQTIQSYDNDYVFFVLEDSKVPLAATPVASASPSASIIVVGAFVLVIVFGYILWYLNIKHNTAMLVSVSPIKSRKDLIDTNSILHPIRSYRASKEAEYSVTQKYFFFS